MLSCFSVKVVLEGWRREMCKGKRRNAKTIMKMMREREVRRVKSFLFKRRPLIVLLALGLGFLLLPYT
jgi:hypothetical protein